ncbi:MAG: hypothetical protein INQ03_13760 [Candidatus Heimdallarchaeota archaeon]|nr:hypothetical protein [Candidatus Heimdallarchaeota archaeon]
MNIVKQKLFLILTFTLLLTALVPQASGIENTLEDGYEMVWNSDMNLTLYFPDTSSYLEGSSYDDLAFLEAQYSANAYRDVFVTREKGMIAVNLMIHWTTDSNAISFADARDRWEADGIKLSTTNDSTPIVDVIPDSQAVEQATRKATDVAGVETVHIRNTTDVDTTSAMIVELTDYNHSSADWIELEQMKMAGSANASIDVLYAYANGTEAGSYTNVLNTDQYIAVQDWFGYLPMPSASVTYVSKIKFTGIQFSEFSLYRTSADYEDDRTNTDYTFSTSVADISASGFNPFTEIATATKNAISQFPVSKTASSIAQRGVGFLDQKASALRAGATALKVDVSDIIDHKVNSARDILSVPSKMSNDIYNAMNEKWDEGERGAQALAREARAGLKAVTLSVGVKAEEFGKAVDHGRELSSSVIDGIIASGGKGASAITSFGSSIFDKGKDALGRLSTEGASLFSKLDPSKFVSAIKDNLKWVIIAVVALVVIVFAIKFMR